MDLPRFIGSGAMLPYYPRFVAALRVRFARFPARARAGFFTAFEARRGVGLAVLATPAISNAGHDTGRACCTCCAIVTAASAACFTVDSTVLRASLQTEP